LDKTGFIPHGWKGHYDEVCQGHLLLEPDPAAVDHHRHAAAGQDLPGAAQPEDAPVGGALSMNVCGSVEEPPMITFLAAVCAGLISAVTTLFLGPLIQHYFWTRQRHAERQRPWRGLFEL